jgi:hypothetical protein
MSRSFVKGKFMLSRFGIIFAPPEFPDDEDKARLARVLNTLLVSGILFLFFSAPMQYLLYFAEKPFNALTVLVLLVIMGAACRLLQHGLFRGDL